MAEVFDIKNHKIINQVCGVALANYIEPEKTLIAETAAAGFFNPIADQLAVGSVIIASVKDGIAFLGVTANADGAVTVAKIASTEG
jgi:hypothetical protein